MLLTGKVKEAVTRTDKGRRVYDAVVVDAPPTGRITRFLNVTAEVAGLARVGPIKSQSDGVMAVLRSPQTAVHVVTLLEEMPVQETVDAVGELRAGRPAGRRGDREHDPPAAAAGAGAGPGGGRRRRPPLAAGGAGGGRPGRSRSRRALAEEAVEHAERWALEDRNRAAVTALGLPTYELPLLPDTVDLGGLYELADRLRDAGLHAPGAR